MEYREFGKTGLWLSGLGFGMNRLPVGSLSDRKEMQNAIDLVEYAIKQGVNYIDVARNYSNGAAFEILRKVMERHAQDVHICIKVMPYHTDNTKEGALQSIKAQLRDLNLNNVDFCFAQAVKSYEEYKQLRRPGGIYEGFLEAQDQGLIRHLCLSSHATVEDTIRIMEEGAFEGMTISYHLLNAMQMQPILDRAAETNTGILTMNSLAGGLIPENPQLFQEENCMQLCQLALQYIYSHKEISCVLSGMQSVGEVDCNVSAIAQQNSVPQYRMSGIESQLFQKNDFCTACDYCKGCPKGIPIKSFLFSYNALLFDNRMYAGQYQREDENLLDDIRLTQEMMRNGIVFPIEGGNPCIGCQSCERKCTQSLPIVARIQTIYQKINQRILEGKRWEERMQEIFAEHYQSIAFYPNCATVKKVMERSASLLRRRQYDIWIIDQNKNLWGNMVCRGIQATVVGLDAVEKLKPQCIVIAHYILGDLLYSNVKRYRQEGIDIKFIYDHNDVPVVYLGG